MPSPVLHGSFGTSPRLLDRSLGQPSRCARAHVNPVGSVGSPEAAEGENTLDHCQIDVLRLRLQRSGVLYQQVLILYQPIRSQRKQIQREHCLTRAGDQRVGCTIVLRNGSTSGSTSVSPHPPHVFRLAAALENTAPSVSASNTTMLGTQPPCARQSGVDRLRQDHEPASTASNARNARRARRRAEKRAQERDGREYESEVKGSDSNRR